MSRKSAGLLIKIAKCPVMADCLAGNKHVCSKVVAAQAHVIAKERGPRTFKHQLPEPWRGHIESAPILFVGSNPSFNQWDKEFPNSDSSDAEIKRYFVDGFERDFDTSVQYWKIIHAIARDLLGPGARPGIDFALTEIVRCKSRRERGLVEAMSECSTRYFTPTLEIAAAPLLVALGKNARAGVADVVRMPSEIGLYGPRKLAGRKRWVLMLGHPSSGERKKPNAAEKGRLQRLLARVPPSERGY